MGRKAKGLLPCPFCGGTAQIRQGELSESCKQWFDGVTTVYVACASCGASTQRIGQIVNPGEDYKTGRNSKTVIKAWNRRTDSVAAGLITGEPD